MKTTVVICRVEQVKLGDRQLGSAGCLSYARYLAASSQDGASSNVPIIVIVGTIGLAVIIVLIVVAIRTFLRCRRRVDEERQPLDSQGHKVSTRLIPMSATAPDFI